MALMMSEIAGMPEAEAEQVIAGTKTGKAIMDHDETVLYEQQTANLSSIAAELEQCPEHAHIAGLLTQPRIVEAMSRLGELEKRSKPPVSTVYEAATQGEGMEQRARLLAKQRRALKEKRQNQRNVRRMEHAD